MNQTALQDGQGRRFACLACGACCNRGPEIERGEASKLADTFIMSVIFKAHSIPLDERTPRARKWWKEQGSRIPLRAAFEEKRRDPALFASRRRSRRQDQREDYLTISAIVDDYQTGTCPALEGGRCSIYVRRPIICRTVPLHYLRRPSTLQSYLDEFATTPRYRCDTTDSAIIPAGSPIASPELRADRDHAVDLAQGDRGWKNYMLSFMDAPIEAGSVELPTYDTIVANTDHGYATLLPIIVAWRIAALSGLIAPDQFKILCAKQLALIRTEGTRSGRRTSCGISFRYIRRVHRAGTGRAISLQDLTMMHSPCGLGAGSRPACNQISRRQIEK